jgi:putative ABC transport system permease protein
MTFSPRLAEWLVRMTAPPEDRLEILGDLHEEAAAMARRTSHRKAWMWYWRQAIASAIPNVAQRRRKRRQQRGTQPTGDALMHTLVQDLKYSLRGIRKSWGFSLVVVLTLSVGIGANTLIYSIVDGVVLNPFPFPEPNRLVGIGSEWPRLSRDLRFWETLSPQEYRDVKNQSQTMEHIVMWDMGYRSLSSSSERPEVVLSGFWFDDVFPTLGMNPIHGRGFTHEELERGDRVAVVSHRHWQTRMGADPTVIGESVFVEGSPYTLIGIMPPKAQIYASDLWIPLGASPDRFPRNRRQMQIMARIKPGYTLEEVNVELAAISGRIEQEYGAEFEEYQGWRMRALPWTDVNVRLVKPAAFALLGAVAFVLVIVCANVASLLLARSSGRRKEIAVRRALGASRGRIVRQLLTENVVLAAIGGVLGAGATYAAVPVMLAAIPSGLPIVLDFSVNARVLLFTGLVAVAVGLTFGLVPAIHGSRSDVQDTLKAEGSATTGGVGRQRLQRVFVGAEFAVALALLVQAGLLANSFVRMQNVDPGFDTSNTLTMRLTLPSERYPNGAAISTFFQQLVERVNALPSVREAGAGTQFPPFTFGRGQFAIEGEQYQTEDELPVAYRTLVTDGYHEALGIPLVRGRTFTPQDTPSTPLVAVINQAAARRYFPNDDPIGKRFKSGGPTRDGPWVTIVGVVRSVHNRGPEVDPQPEFFANIRQIQGGSNQLFLVIRTARDPRGVLEVVQREVAALDPDQPVYAVQTVEDAFATLTAPRRLGTIALTILAVFAIGLAAAGIYAVVSYGVGERTKEIGLRLALGASGSAVRRLVVRQAMIPVAVGGVIGVAAALAAGRALSDFLFQVSGTDPVTVGGVALMLAGFAMVASYIPARRASNLSPTVALRDE